MKIGAALVLIAIGAILRFALTTVVTHGIYLHTVGDILMGVGALGLVLWLFLWGPWARNRSTSYRQTSVRQTSQPDGIQAGTYSPGTYSPGTPGTSGIASERRYEERRYEDQNPS